MTGKKLEEAVMDAQQQASTKQLPSYDQFRRKFESRYRAERSFREMVHAYLKVSRMRTGALSVAKTLHLPWYKSQTGRIVSQYAGVVYNEMAKLSDVEAGMAAMEETRQAMASLQKIDEELYRQKRDIEASYSEKTVKEESAAAQAAAEVASSTDAAKIAAEKAREFIAGSPFVKPGDNGAIVFDDDKLVKRLEELALDEIIDEIAQDQGNRGFMAKLMATYDDVITHWEEIADLSELPNVDWTQSAIFSRTKGYAVPMFPYLITGHGETRGKATIDSAMSIDVSGSMQENQRIVAAKKTGYALNALMRRLNPNNQAYLSVFANYIRPVTSLELRSILPEGGTLTELALEWLIETLGSRGPSIAYLITDGRPNNPGPTFKAAAKFREHPNILLRIFLIDGDAESEGIIREVGKAAGPATKFAHIRGYQLGGKVIADMSTAIGEMYSMVEA